MSKLFNSALSICFVVLVVFSCTLKNDWKEIEVTGGDGIGSSTFFNIDMQKATVRVSEFNLRLKKTRSGAKEYDTINFNYDSTFTIKQTDFKSLLRKLNSNQLDTSINELKETICCHCAAYRIHQIKLNLDTHTAIISGLQNHVRNKNFYQKMRYIYDLLEATLDDPEAIRRAESTFYRYYHKLPIKRIATQPLEYKIWGEFHRDTLGSPPHWVDSLIQTFPNGKPILIDLRGRNSDSLFKKSHYFSRVAENVYFCNGERFSAWRTTLNRNKGTLTELESEYAHKLSDTTWKRTDSMKLVGIDSIQWWYRNLKKSIPYLEDELMPDSNSFETREQAISVINKKRQ